MSDGPVVDARVAFKRVVAEAHSSQAQSLLEDAVVARRRLLAPPHLPSEVLNGLYRRLYRKDNAALSEDEVTAAATQFLALPVEVISPPSLYEDALLFARSHRLPSLYDGLYVTLARLLETELWTADERLLNAVYGIAPWVRQIADYR